MGDFPPDDLLGDRIVASLKAEGHFVVHIAGEDVEEIARIRSLGRKAGRRLGWKVRTFASDPTHREDGRSVVIVAAVKSNPLHEELMRIRSDKKLRAASESWDLGGD